MALSEQRKNEILRLTREGGEELTQAIERGEKATEEHLKKMRGEITALLTTSTDPEELDFFAENWMRDGREWPIHVLIENPHVDAGTLLRVFWYSDPEYFYDGCSSGSELENATERDIFLTLEGIERRLVNGEYNTAAVPFDPRKHVTMRDEYPQFARQIPEVMFRPIPDTGRTN